MFLSFKCKRSQKRVVEDVTSDRIAASIAHKCIKVQQQCATLMQRQTEKLTFKAKKFLLVVFLLLSITCSFYLIIESLINRKNKSFSIASIKFPKHLDKASDESTEVLATVLEAEHRRIDSFLKSRVDSLAKSPSGNRLYDSILNRYPCLIDSIMLSEQVYKSKNQLKNY